MMDESRTSEEGQRELNCLKRRKCRSNPNWTIKEIKVLLKACRDVYNNDKMVRSSLTLIKPVLFLVLSLWSSVGDLLLSVSS